MPRYAKESLEDLLYQQLKDEVEEGESGATSAAVDPDGQTREVVVFKGVSGVPMVARLKAIKAICRCNELGWVRDEVAVEIIYNISSGEK